jgi:hypothetical protein
MIDMDKYDGASKVYITEHMWHGFTEVEEARSGKVLARIYAGDTVKEAEPTPAHHILLDAFALHREVVRLRSILHNIKDIDMNWGIDFDGASITVTHFTGTMLTGKLEVVA